MADKWPLANGNWSNAANWNGGTLPQPGDAVYADGKTVAIDQDVNVLSISGTQRSGGTGGGGFTASFGVGQTLNITANLYKGPNSHLLNLFGDFTLNITGNLYLAGAGSNTHIIYGNSFLGTMNIVGNLDCRGYGPNSVHGINQGGQAEIFLTGNIYAGDGGSASGIYAQNGTNITVTGNVYAGTQGSNFAIYNLSTGFTVLNGNAYASSTAQAVVCNTGLLTVNGNAYGNTSFPAISTGGTLRMNGNSFSGSQGGSITFRGLQIPDSGNFQLQAINYSNAYRSFYTGGQNLGQPTAANVRQGTTFGVSNEFTGTCAVPPAGSVALGVPVDNTTGTASITAANIRAALGLASANLDTQLAGIATDIDNITVDNAAIADAVWDEVMLGHATNGTYGAHFVRSANHNQNTVQITGSNHIASDVHQLQADVIDSDSLASSAVAEIQAGLTGIGARLVSVTVLLNAVAQQSARVRLTKEAESYLATTDANGLATFSVDDGSWTVSITLAGATFAGDTLVVDGNETVSYSLTAVPALTPSDPDKVTGYWLCLSHLGVPESGVTVTLTAMSIPANSTGLVLDSASRSVVSGVDGVVSFNNLLPGVRYKVVRNSGKAFYFVCPEYQADPVDLASFIGT